MYRKIQVRRWSFSVAQHLPVSPPDPCSGHQTLQRSAPPVEGGSVALVPLLTLILLLEFRDFGPPENLHTARRQVCLAFRTWSWSGATGKGYSPPEHLSRSVSKPRCGSRACYRGGTAPQRAWLAGTAPCPGRELLAVADAPDTLHLRYSCRDLGKMAASMGLGPAHALSCPPSPI